MEIEVCAISGLEGKDTKFVSLPLAVLLIKLTRRCNPTISVVEQIFVLGTTVQIDL